MKKLFAFVLLFALTLSAAACGAKTTAPDTADELASDVLTETQTEPTTDPAVTEPEVGRIGEKATFYVYIPDRWCKMEYSGDATRLRMFNTPSAPKIEEGKTQEVEIRVAAEAGKQKDVDAAVAELLKNKDAKKGKDRKIGGETFTVVSYTDAKEKRTFTAYVGLGGGSLAVITLKGIKPSDENAAAILDSISFKSENARNSWEKEEASRQAAKEASRKAAQTQTEESTTAKNAKKTDKNTTQTTTKKAAKTTAAAQANP